MKNRNLFGAAVLACLAIHANALAEYLGTAQSFAVLGGSTVTNTGPSVITGDMGVWQDVGIVGFPPGVQFGGSVYVGNAVAAQAHSDAETAYNTFAGMALNADLSGQDLGGMTLTPGVYYFSSSAQLTGTITLDGQGDPNALFVFQIGSTLTTASMSSVVGINGADGCNVYWQVGSSATLGTTTAFQGSIIALASVTMNTNATILDGRAIALNGAVTMDSNTITAGCVPAPGSLALLAVGGIMHRGRRRRH